MSEITRGEVVRVGVDLAKRVLQFNAVDAARRMVTNRALPRDKFLSWCVQLSPAWWFNGANCNGTSWTLTWPGATNALPRTGPTTPTCALPPR